MQMARGVCASSGCWSEADQHPEAQTPRAIGGVLCRLMPRRGLKSKP